MRRVLPVIIAILLISVSEISKAHAASEADCAIWICLPGGFPAGCNAAYSAFRDRIQHRKPPLPTLSSCTTGPKGEQVDGRYQLGQEIFEACLEGYVLREEGRNRVSVGRCYLARCAPEKYSESNERDCKSYDAVRRTKQSYVKMWVNGDYLGQFWYQ